MEELNSLLDNLKTMKDIVQTLRVLAPKAQPEGRHGRTVREFNEAVIAMQNVMVDTLQMTIEVQTSQSRLISRIHELEQEVKRSEDWSREKGRYTLTDWKGRMAYTVKEEVMESGEIVHYLCANCYTKGVKSFLEDFHGMIVCVTCKG